MSGSYRVDQRDHDPQWFTTEAEATAEAATRTPTINAPVMVWFDSFDYPRHNPVPARRNA